MAAPLPPTHPRSSDGDKRARIALYSREPEPRRAHPSALNLPAVALDGDKMAVPSLPLPAFFLASRPGQTLSAVFQRPLASWTLVAALYLVVSEYCVPPEVWGAHACIPCTIRLRVSYRIPCALGRGLQISQPACDNPRCTVGRARTERAHRAQSPLH